MPVEKYGMTNGQDSGLEAGQIIHDLDVEETVVENGKVSSEKVEVIPDPSKTTNYTASGSDTGFQNPHDLPLKKKWLMTILLALLSFTVTLNSSIFSSAIAVTSKEFEVSETVMLLSVSLFVLGFAIGPLLWGPLSEFLGRKIPLFTGFFLFSLMQIPVALAPNLPAILICRFLAGCFGAAPMVLVSATYTDFWDASTRSTAIAVFSSTVFAGPTLGPILGSLITEGIGWRWLAWFTLIIALIVGGLAVLCVPETYAPLLRENADRLIPGKTRQRKKMSPREFVNNVLFKPALMLVFEPMLVIITIYTSIVYGILYLTFFAFPYNFMHERGWDPRVATLPFLGILIGVLSASLSMTLYTKYYYRPRFLARNKRVLPEDRLPPVFMGSLILPAGLFWFAWTSPPAMSWVPQVFSGIFIGAGIMLIFTNGLAYLVDIYLSSAASAIAANTCVRSFVAAGFPVAAPRMFRTLGTNWATSVLGFLCVLAIPAPFLFYRYGERLRQSSRYAPTKARV